MKLRTGKRFRKARLGPPRRIEQFARHLHREVSDYWACEAWGRPTPVRLVPASKLGRGRWH